MLRGQARTRAARQQRTILDVRGNVRGDGEADDEGVGLRKAAAPTPREAVPER